MSKRSAARLDISVVAVGGLASGAVALGAALLLKASVSTGGGGPTAASLSDAYSLLFGAALGLAAGSAGVAFAVRTPPRILSGTIAGLLGYALIVTLVLMASAPSDLSFSESVSTVALAAVLVTPFILLGAAVGAAVPRLPHDGSLPAPTLMGR